MSFKKNEEKCFTFLWKLKNISYCLEKKGEAIKCPAFVVDAVDQTKWRLRLYPRGNRNGMYVGLFLNRELDSKGADEVEIKYELAFIAKDGSVLDYCGSSKRSFLKNDCFGIDSFAKREDVFISRRSAFLPEDTLTVRCRMWKTIGEMEEDVRCVAHTRIGIQKRSFLWKVKNFSSLEPEAKCTYQIKSTENDKPLMSIDLSLTGGLSSAEIIHFKLYRQDQNFKFSTLQLSLIDAAGNRVKCNQDEFRFNGTVDCKEFTFTFTKDKLLSMKSLFLPGDTLSLHWEWVFSKGIVLEETEEAQNGCISENQISDLKNAKKRKNEIPV